MSVTELNNMLIKQLDELRADVRKMEERMAQEHKELSERVMKLEHDARVTRWIFALGGTIGGFLLRQMLSGLF